MSFFDLPVLPVTGLDSLATRLQFCLVLDPHLRRDNSVVVRRRLAQVCPTPESTTRGAKGPLWSTFMHQYHPLLFHPARARAEREGVGRGRK